jgi:hypothetical protein
VYAAKGSKSINTILCSHIIIFLFLLIFFSCSSSLCCFVEKSIRVDLMRQGSQFRVNIYCDSTGDDVHVLIVAPSFTE